MKAVQVTEFAGSDVLEATECDAPEPTDGEVHLAIEAAGVPSSVLKHCSATNSPLLGHVLH